MISFVSASVYQDIFIDCSAYGNVRCLITIIMLIEIMGPELNAGWEQSIWWNLPRQQTMMNTVTLENLVLELHIIQHDGSSTHIIQERYNFLHMPCYTCSSKWASTCIRFSNYGFIVLNAQYAKK